MPRDGEGLVAATPLAHLTPPLCLCGVIWCQVKSFEDQGYTVHMVSAGHVHSGALTTEGALFCWGFNTAGCCGQPLAVKFMPNPVCVRFLYDLPYNLALNRPAQQSSTIGKCAASKAVDGKITPKEINSCSCTKSDSQAWWQVDLGEVATIQTIKVYNRGDEANGEDLQKNLRRLFPCYIFASRLPFDTEAYGDMSLDRAEQVAICKKRFTDVQTVVVWRLPERKYARYVRIQLEDQNYMGLAQVRRPRSRVPYVMEPM